MTDFAYGFTELAATGVIVIFAASLLLAVYAVAGLVFLPLFGALQRLVGFARDKVAELQATVTGALQRVGNRVSAWRHRHFADIVRDSAHRNVGRGTEVADLFVGTGVFALSALATLMLFVVGAELLGLSAWTSASSLLPWLIGGALVSSIVYSWWRQGRLGLAAFWVDVVAVSLFAVLRGFEIWSQVVPTAAANADGGATLAATAAGSPEHPYVQGARQVLPLPIYALAEIAIVLGAAVATPARPGVWAVIAMGSAAVVELLIGGLRSVVWLTSWALRLLLGITERIIVSPQPSLRGSPRASHERPCWKSGSAPELASPRPRTPTRRSAERRRELSRRQPRNAGSADSSVSEKSRWRERRRTVRCYSWKCDGPRPSVQRFSRMSPRRWPCRQSSSRSRLNGD
jgi:hypothetical protein